MHVSGQALDQAALVERRVAGEHVEEGAAQRVDVAADVGRTGVVGLFGRDVIDGADRGAVAGNAGLALLDVAGQTEVGQLQERLAVLPGNEEVGRLDIAVDDALAVRVGQRLDGLLEQLAGQLGLEPAAALDVLEQVDPLDKFHRQVISAGGLAGVVDGDDVLVAELLGGAGLAAEALAHARVGGQVGRHDLEGDLAVELHVARLVDRGHAAAGDVAEDLVAADALRTFGAFSRGFRAHAVTRTVVRLPSRQRPCRPGLQKTGAGCGARCECYRLL